MRKYVWIGIAGVLVIILILVGLTILPLLFRQPPPETVIVKPALWWKVELNEEQLAVFEKYWGDKEITVKDFMEQICPDVLNELPPDAVSVYSNMNMSWPVETYYGWKQNTAASMYFASVVPQQNGKYIMYEIYADRSEYEDNSFKQDKSDREIEADKSCRISFYTDKVLPKITPW